VGVGKIGGCAIIVLVTQSGFTWCYDAAHAHSILKPIGSSLEVKKKIINTCIWSVALCGSETGTVGKNEERIINAFETWSWRRMLKIKWTDRIMNDEVFQKAKDERLLKFFFFKYRRHSWIGHTVRHNEFAVNILEGSILTYLLHGAESFLRS